MMKVVSNEGTQRFVLGVDGGGTKTHYALFDTVGNYVDFLTSGPTNHESMDNGFDDLRLRLISDLAAILERNDISISQIAGAVLGLAGVDTKRQHEIISSILKDVGLTVFTLVNDSFLGVKAGGMSGYGICVINGTGFSAGGIDRNGKMLQVGGMGNYTGDMGGGGYFATCAIRAVYEHLYKDDAATLLQDMIFSRLGITDKADYPEILFLAMADDDYDVRDFGRFVLEAANLGDTVSIDILKNSGKQYAKSVQGIIQRLDFGPPSDTIDIVIAGSVFVKGSNSLVADTMLKELATKNPNRSFNVVKLASPPVLGAVLWAFELLEIPVLHESIEKELQKGGSV